MTHLATAQRPFPVDNILLILPYPRLSIESAAVGSAVCAKGINKMLGVLDIAKHTDTPGEITTGTPRTPIFFPVRS